MEETAAAEVEIAETAAVTVKIAQMAPDVQGHLRYFYSMTAT